MKKIIKVEEILSRVLKARTHEEIISIVTHKIKGFNIKTYGVGDASFTLCIPSKMKETELLPCFISHTDTVSVSKPTRFELVDGVLSNPDGVLGADDRAGVYILHKMLKKDIRGIYIFTNGEEIGGLGASACVRHNSFQLLLENITCFIELDRQDDKDIALYGYDNTELCSLFEKFGYVQAWGSYTDAVDFSEDTGIACINLSVGYKRQHTKHETLVLKDMEATLDIMLNHLPKELYEKVYMAEPQSKMRYSDWLEDDDILSCYSTTKEVVCEICGMHEKLYFKEELMICEYCMGDMEYNELY